MLASLIRIELLLNLMLIAASMRELLQFLRPLFSICDVNHHPAYKRCCVLQLISFPHVHFFILLGNLAVIIMMNLFGISSHLEHLYVPWLRAIVPACFSYTLTVVSVVRWGVSARQWTKAVSLGMLAEFSFTFRAVRLFRGESVGTQTGR